MAGQPKYKVWWDKKEGIIRNKAWGDFDEQDAKDQSNEIIQLINSRDGKLCLLNDLTDAGTASSGARKIYSSLLKNDKIKKRAFVGMKIVTRVIVSFIMNFSGVKNARYFATEKEALTWLKEDLYNDKA